jgi:vacuolar-type H+-ATPase subunit I/STV1
MSDDDTETARVVADVPADVKETAKEKLPFGGISEEIQATLERIAYGEELGQRSRLERRREELQADLRDARERRREIDAEIATLEDRISGVDDKLSNLTTREDKFEAKIEELEAMLRQDGTRLDPNHAAVKRAAETGGVEPEGVVETLKERNPDVPPYAFEDGLHDRNTWDGLGPDTATLPVEERQGVEE